MTRACMRSAVIGLLACLSIPLGRSVPVWAAEPLDASVSWRGRVEAWNWFDATGGADDSYVFLASLLRASVGQQLPRLDWQVEVSQPTLLGLPDNAVAPAPQGQLGLGASYRAANGGQEGTLFLKQGFARLKGLSGGRAALRLGRFEFADGSETTPADATLAWLKRGRIAHRLLGNFGWSHVQRSLDGVQATWSEPDLNVTLLGAFPVEGVFELDGWDPLKVRILYAAVTAPLPHHSEGRLFLLNTRDTRDTVKTDNRPLAERQADPGDVNVTTLGGHYLRAWETDRGRTDLLLWGGLQWGDWGTLDHQGWGWALEGGYRFSDTPWQPWVRIGWNRTSGDGDAADDDHGTFFQHLPTPRIYARMPFYNLMNNSDLFVQVMAQPCARLQLRSDLHWIGLTAGSDLWYAGGGAFNDQVFGYAGRPGGGRNGLAQVFDVGLDYQVSPTSDVSFYIAHAWGGHVVENIYDGSDATFAYLEWSQRW